MSTLYVDRRSTEIRIDGGALTFYDDNERIGTIPLAPLSRIILRGDVHLSASVLGKLGAHNIGVVILSGRKSEPTLFLGRPHNDAERRVSQYQASLSADFCLNFSRRFITAKLKSQLQLLTNQREIHPDKRFTVTQKISQIEGMMGSLANADSIDTIRGLEGAAAAAYFQALTAIAPSSLNFDGRNRRPPKDPLNVVLSLGYTLLHSDAVLAIYQNGLDPFIGFYHVPDFGRESFASDIIEPLRARIDAFALKLFNLQSLRPDHFTTNTEGCQMGKAGRQIFYVAYESEAEEWRKLLHHYIRDTGQRITGKVFDEDYPEKPDWLTNNPEEDEP